VSKLTKEQIEEIKTSYSTTWASLKDLAKRYNVSVYEIRKVLGKIKTVSNDLIK
jgi:Mor family transcriptional regulator